MKRAVIIVVVLVALGVASIGAYRHFVIKNTDQRSEMTVRPMTNRVIVSVLEETGTVRPRDEVVIKSEVNGRVDAVHVEDGIMVTAGCVLVELDKVNLLNQRKELELDHQESLLNLELAQLGFSRKRLLFLQKLVSPDVYDAARIDCDLKSNRVAKIASQINTIDDNLRKTTIIAPASGTVMNRNIEPGEVVIGANSVSSGTELMKIADLTALEVRSLVNEVDVPTVRTGMTVKVTTDCFPDQQFTGVVEHVAPMSATTTAQAQNQSQSQAQGFEVLVQLSGACTQLKPGMTANLTFIRSAVSNALSAPLSAVFCDDYESALANQKFYMFIKTPSNFAKTFVLLGIQDTEGIEIVSGVTARVRVALERPDAPTEIKKPVARDRH